MIHDLYSKRQKRLRGEVPDVYVFDAIPQSLRIQIVKLWDESVQDHIALRSRYDADNIYKSIAKCLRKEYGVFFLPPTEASHTGDYYGECARFITYERNVERVLDIVELSARRIVETLQALGFREELAEDLIAELNGRFREAGVGFQFIEGEIIRVDSELLHSEAVKPALALLHNKEYAGAQEEFLSAFEHYRHGNCKEALNESLKAFESVMKCICDKREWEYANNDTSKRLISICFKNGLIPDFWQNQFAHLIGLLESGVPTARNNMSAHGQGTMPIEAPDYLVAYVLHMTASAIVFLVEAERAMR